MRNRRTPHDPGNALAMKLDGVGNAINDFLYPALAYGQTEDGQEIVLHSAAAVPMDAAKFSNVGRKSGTEATPFLWRYDGFDYPSASRATASVKNDVFHIESWFGDFDVLVDVVWFKVN